MTEYQLFSNIIRHLQRVLEDIRQDLEGLPLSKPDCRIGDFGCDWAYTTLGLMLALNAAECIGIDKFIDKPPLFPSLQDVQDTLDFVKTTVLATREDSQEDKTIGDIRHLLQSGRWPVLQQNDVVNGSDFPKNLDLAYCRRLLNNIHTGQYDNSPSGKVGVSLAINNIAGCISQGGLVCIVEEGDKIDLEPYLKQANLAFLSMRPIISRKVGHFIACYARKL